MRSIKIGFLSLAFSLCIAQTPLEFYAENISITIGEGVVRVDGDYSFRNNSNRPIYRRLFYPIPVDKIHTYPDSFSVHDLKDGSKIEYTHLPEGIAFPVSLGPKSECHISVSYCQKLTVNQMRYILLTTSFWGQPFERAEYSVHHKKTIRLDYSTINFDTIFSDSGTIHHHTTRLGYFPTQDLTLKWGLR